jgi:hypothetical protein
MRVAALYDIHGTSPRWRLSSRIFVKQASIRSLLGAMWFQARCRVKR